MERVYDSNLQRDLDAYISSVGGQRRAAEIIGYSESTLSTYRSGTYRGDVGKLESRLRELLTNKTEAEQLDATASAPYVPTTVSSGVYDTIRICHLKGGLAVEAGDAGIGKTYAAKKYVEDYPHSTTYISVNPCFSGVTALLKLLCRELHVPTGRKDDMWYGIADRLCNGRRVLIIDEAQHLPIKTIDSLRSFYDCNPELGIVLIGNADTISTARNRESFAQIRNRTKLTEIRHTTHVRRVDIEMLFPAIRGEKRETELLLAVARSEQGVRGAANLWSNAADNGNTTYDGMIAMAKAMHIVMR